MFLHYKQQLPEGGQIFSLEQPDGQGILHYVRSFTISTLVVSESISEDCLISRAGIRRPKIGIFELRHAAA